VGDGASPSSLVFEADSTSLRVLQGVGGMQPLTDDDKSNIEETIDAEVLLGEAIAFRSTAVEVSAGGSLVVQGELTLVGETRPLAFEIVAGESGGLSAKAVLTQSEWGMKPYSALFGALKVADEVEIEVDASEERALAETIEATAAPRSAAIIDPGISSFLWAVLFGLYLLLGMAAIGISWGAAVVLSLVAAFLIFLLVRTHGVGRDH